MNMKAVTVGFQSGGAFGVAILAGAALATLQTQPPIVPAIVAGVVLFALEWQFKISSPHADMAVNVDSAISWSVSFLVAATALAMITALLPSGSAFVCEPLVPWKISIAIFGAFASAWLVTVMRLRTKGERAPLIRLALFWIAPFYGFFHAPWFLAQSLLMPCPERSLAQTMVAAVLMGLTAYAGVRVAAWMCQPPK